MVAMLRVKVTNVKMCVACLFVVMATVLTVPVTEANTRDSEQTSSDVTRMQTSTKLIGDATHFLRTWFQRLRSVLHSSSGDSEQEQIRSKRSTNQEGHTAEPDIKVNEKQSNESSFETYEKKFLINQTLNYLKQIYYYSKYRQQMKVHNQSNSGSQSNTTSVPEVPGVLETSNEANRVDALLSAKMNELNAMPFDQIENIFQNTKRAALNGVVDPGITSLCCPQG